MRLCSEVTLGVTRDLVNASRSFYCDWADEDVARHENAETLGTSGRCDDRVIRRLRTATGRTRGQRHGRLRRASSSFELRTCAHGAMLGLDFEKVRLRWKRFTDLLA